MENSSCNDELYKKVHLTFGIRADDLIPDQITNTLGVKPTRSFAKGDEFQSQDGVHHRLWGLWQLCSQEYVNSFEIEDHAKYIISKIENSGEYLQSLMGNPKYYVAFWVWWEIKEYNGGFIINNKTLNSLSVFCNEVNFTFICSPEANLGRVERSDDPTI